MATGGLGADVSVNGGTVTRCDISLYSATSHVVAHPAENLWNRRAVAPPAVSISAIESSLVSCTK